MKGMNLNDSQNSTQFESIQENPTQSPILCSGKNEAFYLCLDEDCKSSPVFTCWTQKCKCQDKHILCQKGNIKAALRTIRSKLKNTDELKLHIETTFDRIIDQLSHFREDLIKEVDQKMKYIMLHAAEQKLLKISQNEIKTTQIFSSETALLWQIIKGNHEDKNIIFDFFRSEINKFEQHIRQFALSTQQEIREHVKSFKMCKFILFDPELRNSHVVTTSQSQRKLINMFPMKIKSLKLLYQASKNNFSLPNYYDACGTENDTMIVTLTNKDKIFGGYTPHCFWNGSQGWVYDQQKKSFLFSISQNQKFKLINPNQSIYRYSHKTQMIRFGDDFYIGDHANIQNVCQIGSRSSYQGHFKYRNEKESFLKLNGNQIANCSLKEWEVYKVEFEQ